ncbi:MAG: hypothetical protein O6763_06030, partial [Gammaproteobacteria bacterium]|nr:hypothetical protein [Gammaproteobacteria bacterium]
TNLEGQRTQRKGVVRPDYILTIPDKTMTCRAMIMGGVAEFAERHDRPKQTLEFETPAKKFNGCVASTG